MGDATPICLKKQRGEGTWFQEWTGKREVCFHSPKTTLSGISPKLPPSEGSLTREKSQAGIPFLVPDPPACSLSSVDAFALGERPSSFTRNFRSTNNLSPYTETNSTGSGLDLYRVNTKKILETSRTIQNHHCNDDYYNSVAVSI